MNNDLSKFMKNIISMRRLTNVQLINTYWRQAHQIAKTGRLGFIIQGNLQWESEKPVGVKDNDGLWLKSNRYNPIGKHIAEEPVRTYLQWYMNLYEIWGTIDINLDPNNPSTSMPLIEKAIKKKSCINSLLSLLFGVSVRWHPARYGLIKHISISSSPKREETENFLF